MVMGSYGLVYMRGGQASRRASEQGFVCVCVTIRVYMSASLGASRLLYVNSWQLKSELYLGDSDSSSSSSDTPLALDNIFIDTRNLTRN